MKVLSDSVKFEYNSLFTDGTKNKLLGNTNQAILCFSRCLELNPYASGPYYQLSDIYSSINDIQKALLFSKKAYQYDKNNQWYIIQLTKLYQSIGNIDSTIILYEQLIKLEPRKEEYYLNLAFLYFKKGKSSKSIHLLTSFLNKNYVSEEIALSLYQIYKYNNDNKQALEILKIANQKFPGETRFYGLLAEQYVSVNSMDSAYYYYKKLLDIDPANEKGILSLIEYYRTNSDTVNYINLTKKFIYNSDFQLSDKVDLINALINDKNYFLLCKSDIDESLSFLSNLYKTNLNLYVLQAEFYLKLGNLRKAKDNLVFVVDTFTVKYLIWEQLFSTLHSLNLNDSLLYYSDLAKLKFPNNPYPYLHSGIANYFLKKYEKAILDLSKGVQFEKLSKTSRFQFFYYLGECYQTLNEYEKSEYYFNKIIQDDFKNYLVLNNYSFYLALRNKDLDKALQYSKLCILNNPNSSTYLDTYAWILFKMGKYADAKSTIEKALMNNGSENLEIIEHYCEILYYFGDKQKAIKYYKILEEKGRTNQSLKTLLQIE